MSLVDDNVEHFPPTFVKICVVSLRVFFSKTPVSFMLASRRKRMLRHTIGGGSRRASWPYVRRRLSQLTVTVGAASVGRSASSWSEWSVRTVCRAAHVVDLSLGRRASNVEWPQRQDAWPHCSRLSKSSVIVLVSNHFSPYHRRGGRSDDIYRNLLILFTPSWQRANERANDFGIAV